MNTRNRKRNMNRVMNSSVNTNPTFTPKERKQDLKQDLKQLITNSNDNNNTKIDTNTDNENVNEMDVNSDNDWSEEKDLRDGKKVFVCKRKLCWFRTNTESLIKKHLMKHSKPYMCSFVGCGQRFADTKHLLTHFSCTHLGSNAFQCTFPECELRFADIKSLTEHRISHVSNKTKPSKAFDDKHIALNNNESETQTDSLKRRKTTAFKNLMIEQKLKKEKRTSIRLSDCLVDNQNDWLFIEDNDKPVNAMTESQDYQNCDKLTTTIELANTEPDIDCNEANVESNERQAFRKKSVNSVIRCSKVTDEIIEGNNNFIKLRSTEGKFWYKCLWDYCDYGNINEAMIIKHVHKHEFPFKCSFEACNKCFATLSQMAEHRELTHSGISPYTCDWPQCEEAFQSWQLLSHHKRKHLIESTTSETKVKKVKEPVESKPFLCSFGRCNMHYASKEELEVHQLIHSGDRPFKCLYPECTFAAKTSDKLRIHHSRHSAVKAYKCLWPTCHKSFTISEQLRRHRKVHTDRETFVCEFVNCDLVFETVDELETHLRQHLGFGDNDIPFQKIDFKCNFGLCKMHFQTEEALQKHSETHKGKRLYKCGFHDCSYSGKTLDKLTAHIRYHSDERPFKCDFVGCHQEFIQSHHLVRHRKSHFGDQDFDTSNKPVESVFICNDSQCLQTFSTEKSLKSHRFKSHFNDGRKSLKGKSLDSSVVFSTNDLDFDSNRIVVKRNAKKKLIEKKLKKMSDKCVEEYANTKQMSNSSNDSMKQFCCDFGKCKFRCITETELNQHKELHSGERRFECRYYDCTFRTNRKDKLVIHTRRHTGEKPYECDWNDCNQAFITRDRLNSHKLTHGRSKQTLKELKKLDQEIDQTLQELDQLLEENIND